MFWSVGTQPHYPSFHDLVHPTFLLCASVCQHRCGSSSGDRQLRQRDFESLRTSHNSMMHLPLQSSLAHFWIPRLLRRCRVPIGDKIEAGVVPALWGLYMEIDMSKLEPCPIWNSTGLSCPTPWALTQRCVRTYVSPSYSLSEEDKESGILASHWGVLNFRELLCCRDSYFFNKYSRFCFGIGIKMINMSNASTFDKLQV